MYCESVRICAEAVSFSSCLLSLLLKGCSPCWAAGTAVSAVVPKALSFKMGWAGNELLLRLFKATQATQFAFPETGWGMLTSGAEMADRIGR